MLRRAIVADERRAQEAADARRAHERAAELARTAAAAADLARQQQHRAMASQLASIVYSADSAPTSCPGGIGGVGGAVSHHHGGASCGGQQLSQPGVQQMHATQPHVGYQAPHAQLHAGFPAQHQQSAALAQTHAGYLQQPQPVEHVLSHSPQRAGGAATATHQQSPAQIPAHPQAPGCYYGGQDPPQH